jgi:hypothetical protein
MFLVPDRPRRSPPISQIKNIFQGRSPQVHLFQDYYLEHRKGKIFCKIFEKISIRKIFVKYYHI